MAIEKIDTSESAHLYSQCDTVKNIQSATAEWYKSTIVPLAGYVQYLCDTRVYRTVVLSRSATGEVCCMHAKDNILSKNEALGLLLTSMLKYEEIQVTSSI